jgi:gamma-glutamyltranspeptidase
MSYPDGPWTGRPAIRAERGAVATPHHLASSAGLGILREGGSAVDAAIAANAVLCVTYPHMAGLGGDAFLLVAPAEGPVRAINGSGPAAAGADRERYRDVVDGDEIPSRGPLAALTVPGAVDAWRLAHDEHGKLPWDRLFRDAIHHAGEGVAVSRSVADWSADDEAELTEHGTAGDAYLVDRRAGREGERFRIPGLAATFERLATQGPRAGFYEGETADRLGRACEEAGSPLRADDLAAFEAEWVEPLRGGYRGATVWQLPPNTQGFAALQLLGMLEAYDVPAWGDVSADLIHHAAEIVKLAFADRDEWLTDPRYVDAPLDRLLSADYLAERRQLIDPERAAVMEQVEPGIRFGSSARRSPEGDTIYLCAVDDDGLAVSLIESIYHDFGSMFVPDGTGVLLQNRGSFFSLDDDHANRLEPGKRTFHTLIPAMLTDDAGRPQLAYGTMGGEGQPQTQMMLLLRLLDLGLDVQQALEQPRWLMGRTWGDPSQELSLEGRVPDGVVRELVRRGQPVTMLPDWDDNTGHAQAIRIHPDGYLEAGADPRGDGLAIGW